MYTGEQPIATWETSQERLLTATGSIMEQNYAKSKTDALAASAAVKTPLLHLLLGTASIVEET